MRLETIFPTGWAEARRDIDAVSTDLGPYPDDERGWCAGLLAGQERVRFTSDTRIETASGFPVRVVEAEILSGDQAGAVRLGAFFRFLELGGAILFHATDRAALERWRAIILQVIGSARPGWGAELVAVSDLWLEGL